MHARNAASVFPEPVGAEISVVRPARMCGHPCSCGSVGVPNFFTNHSCTTGWAQARESGMEDIRVLYTIFAKDSLFKALSNQHSAKTTGVSFHGDRCLVEGLIPAFNKRHCTKNWADLWAK